MRDARRRERAGIIFAVVLAGLAGRAWSQDAAAPAASGTPSEIERRLDQLRPSSR